MSFPFTTGDLVAAADMNAIFPNSTASADWSPTLLGATTNPTLAGTSGEEQQMGFMQFVWAKWTFAASGGGSGLYSVDLPQASSGIATSSQVIGSWWAFDDSVPGNTDSGLVLLSDSDTAIFREKGPGTTQVSDTFPFAFAGADILTFFAQYPVSN